MAKFHFDLVKERVNPADFFALTAIQLTIPDLFDAIRDNKELFSGVPGNDVVFFRYLQKRRFNKILDKAENASESKWRISRESLEPLLAALFPRIAYCTESFAFYDKTRQMWSHAAKTLQIAPDTYNAEATKWKEAKRICSREIFDGYFLLPTWPQEKKLQVVREILDVIQDDEKTKEEKEVLLDKKCKELRSEKKITYFLAALEEHAQGGEKIRNPVGLIAFLLDLYDSLTQHYEPCYPKVDKWSECYAQGRIHSIIRSVLSTMTERKRLSAVTDAIGASNDGVSMARLEVRKFEDEHAPYAHGEPIPDFAKPMFSKPKYLSELNEAVKKKEKRIVQDEKIQEKIHKAKLDGLKKGLYSELVRILVDMSEVASVIKRDTADSNYEKDAKYKSKEGFESPEEVERDLNKMRETTFTFDCYSLTRTDLELKKLFYELPEAPAIDSLYCGDENPPGRETKRLSICRINQLLTTENWKNLFLALFKETKKRINASSNDVFIDAAFLHRCCVAEGDRKVLERCVLDIADQVAGQPAQEEAPEGIAQEKHETKRMATEAPEKNKKQNRSLWARLRGRR